MIDNSGLEQNPIVGRLRSWNPEAIAEVYEFRGELTLLVSREYLSRVAAFLQAESGLEFDFLSDVSVVDRFPAEPRFELNYHLVSIPNRQVLRLRVNIPSGTRPTIATITSV